MAERVEDMVAAAKAEIPEIAAGEARRLVASGEAVLVDVREDAEVAKGKAKGAVHASRGTIEFKADPNSQTRHAALDPERTVVVYCGSGARAALAGRTLKALGYRDVRNMGGFKDWVEAGGEVEDG